MSTLTPSRDVGTTPQRTHEPTLTRRSVPTDGTPDERRTEPTPTEKPGPVYEPTEDHLEDTGVVASLAFDAAAEATVDEATPYVKDLKQSDDPLQMLRHCVTKGKKISFSHEWITFDELEPIHKTTKCAYRMKASERDPKKELMDIGSLWYMWHATSGDWPYTQETCRKKEFKYLNIMLRSDLNDWLASKRETCPGVDMKMIDGKKRPRDDSATLLNKYGPNEKRAKKKDQPLTVEDYKEHVHPVRELNDVVCSGVEIPHVDEVIQIAKDVLANWESRAVPMIMKQWEEEHGTEQDQKAADKELSDGASSDGGATSDGGASEAESEPEEPPAPNGEQIPAESQPEDGHVKLALHTELETYMSQDADFVPIILVPCNKKAPVNMLNAMEFFQNGIYNVPTKDELLCFESTRPEVIKIKRNLSGKIWQFEIRDNTKRFTKLMWKRTICVVLDGTDWQFRGWPFKTVLDMLYTFKGIYFKESGVQIHEHVHEWACEKLELPPLQLTHRFASVRDEMFQILDEYLNTHRQRRFTDASTLGIKIKAVRTKAVL